MDYVEAIKWMQALPERERTQMRWDAIPQQVHDSMAFAGQPVSLEWLKELHSKAELPEILKTPESK